MDYLAVNIVMNALILDEYDFFGVYARVYIVEGALTSNSFFSCPCMLT